MTVRANCACSLTILFLIHEQLRHLLYETLRLTPVECLPLHPNQNYITLLRAWQTVAEATQRLPVIVAETWFSAPSLNRQDSFYLYIHSDVVLVPSSLHAAVKNATYCWVVDLVRLLTGTGDDDVTATSRRVQGTTEPSIEVVARARSG